MDIEQLRRFIIWLIPERYRRDRRTRIFIVTSMVFVFSIVSLLLSSETRVEPDANTIKSGNFKITGYMGVVITSVTYLILMLYHLEETGIAILGCANIMMFLFFLVYFGVHFAI